MTDFATRTDLFAVASKARRTTFAGTLSENERDEWPHDFANNAHAGQLPPENDWRVWLVMAGRGFGKTRAGAEWVRAIAEADEHARIALVAASLNEARAVMVEGESGILACCPPEIRPRFEPSLRRLSFPNGAQAKLYSAGEPESLRGPQSSHAWCDEIAKWPLASEAATRCWDNLLMGLRLGSDPRVLATTTPRAVPLVRRLLGGEDDGSTAVTRGTTFDNSANLPARFLETMQAEYSNTALGRQELEGELLEDVEGALWTRSTLERCRRPGAPGIMVRVVVGVDPPASARGDECGIVVAGIDADGGAHVLADASVERPTPEQWARKVAETAHVWDADRVIAEANQGGDMVASVLRAAGAVSFGALPVKLVHASRGKAARAEPIAALYEAGRVRHAGMFGRLEDQLCGLMAGGSYEGPGKSPDRADALVWALSELMLGRRSAPKIRKID